MVNVLGQRQSPEGGLVKSADRALAVLEYLAESGEVAFPAIVRDLKIPVSSAHHLLQTMLHRRFIEYDHVAHLFKIGFRAWEVAQSYVMEYDLVSLAQPLMDELGEITTETIQLARLDGLDNVYLAISESSHAMKLVSSVGARLPAHATGLGKTLLANLPEGCLDLLLGDVILQIYTDRTITDHNDLRLELARIRRRGYGEDNEEYVVGCRCIAMQIRNGANETIAAMSVSLPTPRYSNNSAARALAELRRTVSRLEHRLAATKIENER